MSNLFICFFSPVNASSVSVDIPCIDKSENENSTSCEEDQPNNSSSVPGAKSTESVKSNFKHYVNSQGVRFTSDDVNSEGKFI